MSVTREKKTKPIPAIARHAELVEAHAALSGQLATADKDVASYEDFKRSHVIPHAAAGK